MPKMTLWRMFISLFVPKATTHIYEVCNTGWTQKHSLISSSYMKFHHAPVALLWSERHLAFHCPLAAGGKIKNCNYKNIPVSFYFITTWNQEVFLCSLCTYIFSTATMVTRTRLSITLYVYYSYLQIYVVHLGLWDTRWRSSWGTALQTGRSRDRFPMASLEFFIDINFPAALWSWGWLSL
jgi:hypothetical protein